MKLPKYIALSLVFTGGLLSGCYVYDKQSDTAISQLDVGQSLKVASIEIKENKFTSVLAIWALRDQAIDASEAEKVSKLYFENIDKIDSENRKARKFSVWHLTWAISNMYRLAGDENVRRVLKSAYMDAAKRVEKLDSKIATEHFRGSKIVMGDIHGGGRAYAHSHLVAPGNPKYLQSFDEYLESGSK